MSPGHIQTDRRWLPEESLQPVRTPTQEVFVIFQIHALLLWRLQPQAPLRLSPWLNRKPAWKDGSTATCMLVVDDMVYVANLGDSRVSCTSQSICICPLLHCTVTKSFGMCACMCISFCRQCYVGRRRLRRQAVRGSQWLWPSVKSTTLPSMRSGWGSRKQEAL